MNLNTTNRTHSPHPSDQCNTPNRPCQAKSTLDTYAISEQIKINVYEHGIELIPKTQKKQQNNHATSTRGKISEFSPKSRYRLFKILAKLDRKLKRDPLFISLTYHHGHERSQRPTKSQLHHFLVCLKRQDPNVEYIWRIELQKRGAPHYHLIIFPDLEKKYFDNSAYYRIVSLLWHEIADPKSRKHKEYGCKITTIHNYREACMYLSKYIAKVDSTPGAPELGRHWGASRNLPIKIMYTIEVSDREARKTMEKIKLWFITHGKLKFAETFDFSTNHKMFFFIDENDFDKLFWNDEAYEQPRDP